MRLRATPTPPRWIPAFAVPVARVRQSWEKFVSERYWDVPLDQS
jgi:hypothetical protein